MILAGGETCSDMVCFDVISSRFNHDRGVWQYLQVVRHERASVKADMWSYGILVWELISNQDITNLQPLAIAQAMQVNLCLTCSRHTSRPSLTTFCGTGRGRAV